MCLTLELTTTAGLLLAGLEFGDHFIKHSCGTHSLLTNGDEVQLVADQMERNGRYTWQSHSATMIS